MALRGLHLRGVLAITIILAGLASNAVAEDADTAAQEAGSHPLAWTFRYASARSDYIRENIRDYSCRLIKRERIDGELQDHQFIKVQMRCEQRRGDDVVRPMAVFMQFLAPSSLKGRQVLFIDGENDGLMQVRKGGRAFKYVKLQIDPKGNAAKRESNYPITDVGFDRIIQRLIERVEDDIKNDPTAANTKVEHFRKARVGDRTCTHIRVIHPDRGEGIEFYKASLYIDDEFKVPVRLTVHSWPEGEDEEPPLMEEYTYVDLKLNVGLSDEEFSMSRLDSSR